MRIPESCGEKEEIELSESQQIKFKKASKKSLKYIKQVAKEKYSIE
jgi:hypothetical protein